MGPGSWAQTLRVPWVPCATGARDWVTCSKAAPARLASRNLLGPWDTVKAMHKCGQLSHLYTLVNKMKDVELCLLKLLVPGLLSSSTVHGHMAKKRRTGRDQCLECNPGFYRDGVICKPFSCETGSANGCISAAKPACGSAVAQSLTGARQTRLNYLISSLAHIGTKARLVARK